MRKRRIVKSSLVVLLVLLCSVCVIYKTRIQDNATEDVVVNELRLESHPVMQVVNAQWPLNESDTKKIKALAKSQEIDITIIDLEETILFSTQKMDAVDGYPLSEALTVDHYYLTTKPNTYKMVEPIYSRERVVAFAIIEKMYAQANCHSNQTEALFAWLLISCVIITIWLILIYFKPEKDKQIQQLKKGMDNLSVGIYTELSMPEESKYDEIVGAYNLLVKEIKYQNAKWQAEAKKRKKFLTVISHEIKTPISTITAYVEALRLGIGQSEEAKNQYINIIDQKIGQLAKQVNEFFDYAKDEAEAFQYERKECYADELIERLFHAIKAQQRGKTKINNQLTKCMICVDPFRIEQVVANVYSNAVKHTQLADDIVLTAYREEYDCVISIKDAGEGISPKDLPYIFDYYYQGGENNQTKYEGGGLGLPICKQIITAHKGSMSVKSEVGKGTEFIIRIPLV